MSGTKRVVVVGASGFGRESLDVLESMAIHGSQIQVCGVVDDSPSEKNLRRLSNRGVHYIGTIATWLSTVSLDVMFVLGIGNPEIRRELAGYLEARGLAPFTAIHPTAIVGTNARIAPGVVICAGTVISTNVQIGRQVHLNPHATIGHDTIVGSFSSINPGAVISGEVNIREGVLVGASATVLQRLTIGEGAVVGAGSVVTKHVPPGVVVMGIPGVWS